MMYQATIEIRDRYEHETFEQLVSIFEMHRANKEKPLPTREEVTAAIDAQYGKPQQAAPAAPVKDEAIVGSIGTADATITDAKLIDAFTKYAPGKNAAVLKELLAKYGATRVAGIAQKRRAEFLAEIGG